MAWVEVLYKLACPHSLQATSSDHTAPSLVISRRRWNGILAVRKAKRRPTRSRSSSQASSPACSTDRKKAKSGGSRRSVRQALSLIRCDLVPYLFIRVFRARTIALSNSFTTKTSIRDPARVPPAVKVRRGACRVSSASGSAFVLQGRPGPVSAEPAVSDSFRIPAIWIPPENPGESPRLWHESAIPGRRRHKNECPSSREPLLRRP